MSSHNFDDFPKFPNEVPALSWSGLDDEPSQNAVSQAKKPFENKLNPNDDITLAKGFIHDINVFSKDGKDVFFVNVGLKKGSAFVDGAWVTNFENASLVLGVTLRKLGETLSCRPDFFKGIIMDMEIKNYRSSPSIYNDKPVVDRKGVLESLKIGFIEY